VVVAFQAGTPLQLTDACMGSVENEEKISKPVSPAISLENLNFMVIRYSLVTRL
jgi:hypothetical protein